MISTMTHQRHGGHEDGENGHSKGYGSKVWVFAGMFRMFVQFGQFFGHRELLNGVWTWVVGL